MSALPVAEYAQSLGLLSPPKLRFLKRVGKKVVALEVGGATEDAAALLEGEWRGGGGSAGREQCWDTWVAVVCGGVIASAGC